MEDLDLDVVIVKSLDILMTYAILDLSVVIVRGLDILMEYAILCIVDHLKMLMLLSLTPQVINVYIYLTRNIMSIFSVEQVSIHIYQ